MTNAEIESRISNLIHNEKYRHILHRKLIDGVTYEALAEETDRSPRGIQYIVKRYENLILH